MNLSSATRRGSIDNNEQNPAILLQFGTTFGKVAVGELETWEKGVGSHAPAVSEKMQPQGALSQLPVRGP